MLEMQSTKAGVSPAFLFYLFDRIMRKDKHNEHEIKKQKNGV